MNGWTFIEPTKRRRRVEAPARRCMAVEPKVHLKANGPLSINRAACEEAGLKVGDPIALLQRGTRYALIRVPVGHPKTIGRLGEGSHGRLDSFAAGTILNDRGYTTGTVAVEAKPGEIHFDGDALPLKNAVPASPTVPNALRQEP